MEMLRLINSHIIYAYVAVIVIILVLLIKMLIKASNIAKHLNENIIQATNHIEEINESIKLTTNKFKQSVSSFKKAFVIFTLIYLVRKDYKESNKKSISRSMINGARKEFLTGKLVKVKL